MSAVPVLALAMEGADVIVGAGSAFVPGEAYISNVVIRFPPYPGAGFLTAFATPAILKAQGATWKVDTVAYIAPADLLQYSDDAGFKVPPDFNSGRGKPWCAVIKWTATATSAGGDYSQAGLDKAVRVMIGAAAVGIGYLTFRSFTTVAKAADNVGKGAGSLLRGLSNPGLVLAALVGLIIVVQARKG